jgi:hypothetical protein
MVQLPSAINQGCIVALSKDSACLCLEHIAKLLEVVLERPLVGVKRDATNIDRGDLHADQQAKLLTMKTAITRSLSQVHNAFISQRRSTLGLLLGVGNCAVAPGCDCADRSETSSRNRRRYVCN